MEGGGAVNSPSPCVWNTPPPLPDPGGSTYCLLVFSSSVRWVWFGFPVHIPVLLVLLLLDEELGRSIALDLASE